MCQNKIEICDYRISSKSRRRLLILWSSLVRRHFEGGQISRVATKVLVILLGERAHCVLFRINVNILRIYARARNNNDAPLPHAARIRGRRLVH